MPISGIQSQTSKVTPTDIPLERIASSKSLNEEQKVAEMTRQFEAVLIRQVISQAQKPAFKSSLTPNAGVSSSIYQDMMVNQIADKISSARTLGISRELQSQVSRQMPGHRPAVTAAKPEAQTHPEISKVSKTESPKNAPPVPLTKAPRL